MKFIISVFMFSVIGFKTFFQTTTSEKPLLSPKILPGDGLSQYDFFYAGESKTHNMYFVKGGQVVWRYNDTATTKSETSDVVLMTNSNILRTSLVLH